MKRLQRTSWITGALMALVGTAFAQGTQVAAVTPPNPERVESAGIPPECDQFRTVLSDSRSATLPWEQRLSLAACRETLVLQPVTSADQLPAMLSQIDQAMQPSIAIYQDAIARGPTPQIQILAAYGLAMTHVNSIVRARSAIATSDVIGIADVHAQLEPMLTQHRDAAAQAFDKLMQIADANPAVANNNAVISFVVGDANSQMKALQPIVQPNS
jgi:hypothetical protein